MLGAEVVLTIDVLALSTKKLAGSGRLGRTKATIRSKSYATSSIFTLSG